MPTQEGFFPLVLWATGICRLLSPPRPSQQFQHLSVRLITRETEKQLVLDQKFKPRSESLTPSFLFLMQRWAEAGSKTMLVLQMLRLRPFGVKADSSAHRGHVLKLALYGNPALERAGGCQVPG